MCSKCDSCRCRVQEMYMYESYQRMKRWGSSNVCAVEYLNDDDGYDDDDDSTQLPDDDGNHENDDEHNDHDDSSRSSSRSSDVSSGEVQQFIWSEELCIKYDTYELLSQQSSYRPDDNDLSIITADDWRLDPFIIDFKSIQNANHYYVAVSRAKQQLRLNQHAWHVMQWLDKDIGGIRTRLRQILGIDI